MEEESRRALLPPFLQFNELILHRFLSAIMRILSKSHVRVVKKNHTRNCSNFTKLLAGRELKSWLFRPGVSNDDLSWDTSNIRHCLANGSWIPHR